MKMFKILLWITYVILCIGFISCEKDNVNNNSTDGGTNSEKTYLPKRIYGIIDNKEWSISFEYDNQNRLIKATIPHKNYGLNIDYPNGKVYHINYIDLDNNTVYRTVSATQDGNIVNELRDEIKEGEVIYTDNSLYEVKNDRITHYKGENFSILYSYDSMDNLSRMDVYYNDDNPSNVTNILYDDKNGIFKNIKTPWWIFWDHIDVDYVEELYFFANNVLEIRKESELVYKYSYNYNTSNYPISFKYIEYYNSEVNEISVNIEY